MLPNEIGNLTKMRERLEWCSKMLVWPIQISPRTKEITPNTFDDYVQRERVKRRQLGPHFEWLRLNSIGDMKLRAVYLLASTRCSN